MNELARVNELASMSDKELDVKLAELKERELSYQTKAGMKYAAGKMREFIAELETWGYKFDGDETGLAILWAKGLQDEVVRIGYDGVGKAIENWALEDEREYKIFPKVAWIKGMCDLINGDPRVEKGRRMQKEAERRMEEDHKKEMAEILSEHPELRARIAKIKAEKGLV